MKALDTNVVIRFLLDDDPVQSKKARQLLEAAEGTTERLRVTTPVVLDTIWVLTAVYDFQRHETLRVLELLTEMPVLEFEDHEATLDLIRLGKATNADLPDLVIGLAARSNGCATTLTFEKGLAKTELFEEL